MRQRIEQLLLENGIAHTAPLSLSACTLTRPYLLERMGITQGTAFLFVVPYYTTHCDDPARNISAYAVSRDYHLFISELFERILPVLRTEFPAHRFAGFTDHSPIAEADAAARAGLGVLGCNHLLLTKEYSSFIFLGEIITDAMIDAPGIEPDHCPACGACLRACPVSGDIAGCRSALTQKKGVLDDEQCAILQRHGLAWGCDICQESCPFTVRARERGTLYTTIPFFTEQAIPRLDVATLTAMTDEELATRAFGWRGRATILRNLHILEKGENT